MSRVRDTSTSMFGVETEYAFTAFDRNRRALPRDDYLQRLFSLVKRRLPHLVGMGEHDLFLANGARLYIDVGLHSEYATPECVRPDEVVAHLRAGDRLMGEMAAELETSEHRVAEALVSKCNVDYATGATWGSHESYLHLRAPAEFHDQVIPHLVSRVLYTGAGGFDNTVPGLRFLVSPRVPHLVKAVSNCSQRHRGIFHTKDEPLCEGDYHRLHVLCGESLYSESADCLRIGTTALIVALIDAGLQPGRGMELLSPVRAMRSIAQDPACSVGVPRRSGDPVTALDIQRHYLDQVESRLDAAFMPDWAGDLCRRWRGVLERVESAPESLVGVLDWPLKLMVFRERCARRGFDWDTLGTWSEAFARISADGRILIADRSLAPASQYRRLPASQMTLVREHMDAAGLDCDRLDGFLALRHELFEIDTRFSQLGERGIFADLDRTGARPHRVVDDERIDRAARTAPQATRARRRGECVTRLAEWSEKYRCGWSGVWADGTRRILDLSDPFHNAPG